MLVILSNGNGSSHCIYHTEDNFYQQYHYIWGISQSLWLNIYQAEKSKSDGNGTVSQINTYIDLSDLELTQYNYTQVKSNILISGGILKKRNNNNDKFDTSKREIWYVYIKDPIFQTNH